MTRDEAWHEGFEAAIQAVLDAATARWLVSRKTALDTACRQEVHRCLEAARAMQPSAQLDDDGGLE